MNRDENAELKEEIASLQSAYDELKKDCNEWADIAETRLNEIRRLRQVIRGFNKNADSCDD